LSSVIFASLLILADFVCNGLK